MRTTRRGIALIITLLFSGILVMMLSATLISTHGGSIFSQDYHGKTAAYYAAESGLAVLQSRLEANPGYASTTTNEPTPFGTGSFSIRFGSGGCVNNFNGTSPVSGPRGPVLPGSAYVKIEGQALGHREVVECVLGRKDDDLVAAAVVASGKIHLEGDVKVSGRLANDQSTVVPADVISNYREDTWTGSAPLYYNQGVGDTASIVGTVRSASPNPGAISPDFAGAATDALTNQAPVPVDNVDIQGEIDSKIGNPSPPLTTSTLTGDYYSSGSHTITGDLILNNGRVYVNGNLTVIGSIKGNGAVYVAGNTTFSGDAEITASEDGVVLYSQGNISLRGFDGTEYMDAIAANGTSANQLDWQHTKKNFELLGQYLSDPAGTRFRVGAPNPSLYWQSDVAIIQAYLANSMINSAAPHPFYSLGGRDNLLYNMLQLVKSQPDSPAKRFMERKFDTLRDGRQSSWPAGQNLPGALGITYSSTLVTETAKIINFVNNGVIDDGLFNKIIWLKTSRLEGDPNQYSSISDAQVDLAVVKMTNWLSNYDYDKLGSSYFQGRLYTRGALYAANEVTIVGSVAAVADPLTADSRPDFQPAAGVSLRPGDLYLANGTTVTYIEDLRPGYNSGEPNVGVRHWLR